MFLLTGRGILEGKVCYADLFDHKGPVLFWLESIGYAMGGRTGVWVFQCLLAIADVILLERIFRKLNAKPLLAVISAAAVFFYTFSHGNLTEELSMPLILTALLLEVEFLASDNKTHSPWYAFVYGVIIGLLAFIRINNAISICVLILCIGVILVKEKQWSNIVFNFFAGIAGIAVVALPVCLYFYVHDALNDMIYATFLHNLIYAKEHTHAAILSKYFLNFVFMYAPGVFAVVIFALKAGKDRNRLYISLAVSSAVTYLMLIYSNVYAHYFTLGIPLFAVSVACAFPEFEIKSIKKFFKQGKIASVALTAIVCAFALLSIYSAGAPFYKTYISKSADEQYYQISESMKAVPEKERNSVIGYGVLADFYIHADVTPCYKYYTLQKWMTSEKRDVYGEFIEYLLTEHPLWLVTRADEHDGIITAVLDKYTLVTSDDYYSYYRYKE